MQRLSRSDLCIKIFLYTQIWWFVPFKMENCCFVGFFSLSAFGLVCPSFHHSYCLKQMVIPSLDTATGRIVAQDLCYFIKNQEGTALSLFAHQQLNKCGSKGTVFAWYRFFSLVQELGNYQSWFLILSHHPESLHRLFWVQWQTG